MKTGGGRRREPLIAPFLIGVQGEKLERASGISVNYAGRPHLDLLHGQGCCLYMSGLRRAQPGQLKKSRGTKEGDGVCV